MPHRIGVGTDPTRGKQYTLEQAKAEFGEAQIIGIVEVSPEGARVTAGTYATSKNHIGLSKNNLGAIEPGQKRFGFAIQGEDVWVGPSSTGFIPTEADIPAIREALKSQGFLTPGAKIVIEPHPGADRSIYNLATGEKIR